MDKNAFIRENYLIASDGEIAEYLGITPKAVRERRRRMGLAKDADSLRDAQGKLFEVLEDSDQVSDLTEDNSLLQKLLDENGIDPKVVKTIRLNTYQQGQKGKDGSANVLNLSGASVIINRDDEKEGPEWPVVQPADPVIVKPFNVNKISRQTRVAVILPDPQIGFRRNIYTDVLDPFHDEQAIAVALEVAKDVAPDEIINLGDFIDNPQFGKYAKEPGFQLTVQPSINYGHKFLALQKAICDTVVVLEGNHDVRLQNYIMMNAIAAFGLKRADAPDGWPVLSIPYLLAMDSLGVDYVGAYPAGEYYINDRLRCEHGTKHGPRGTIAKKVISDENVSVITGHTHRVEVVHRTSKTRSGPRVNAAFTLGCLCRTDGAVPSVKSGTNAEGNAYGNVEDWQQAIGIVEYVPGDGPFAVTPVMIEKGTAVYNGSIYSS